MPDQPPETQTLPPGLEIRLFGPMEVLVAGQPLPPLRSRREQWLLALLVLRHGRASERAWLAATLWPDSLEEQGLFYLRRALTNLRQALGAEENRLQSIPPHRLMLDVTGIVCDLAAFDQAAAGHDEEALANAVMLCRGPLLEGCLEEWILTERARDANRHCKQCSENWPRRPSPATTMPEAMHIGCGGRLAADPACEEVQRRLMECLAAQGDYAGLVQSYRTFRLYLHHELQSRPCAGDGDPL